MNIIATQEETTGNRGLSERASGLNEIGAHYFAGWLISAGFQQPELMTEIETVLQEMESDPGLRHCSVQEAPAVQATFATETIPSPEPQSSVASSVESPDSVAAPAPPNPLRSFPPPEAASARRLPLAARIFASIFPRRRLAA
jgi:hypothetical protein